VDQLVTIDEGTARAMFGNDLTDGEWATWWPRFVPEAPGLINAHLSGYPTGIPTTYIALTDDVAVPSALWDQMIGRIGADTVTRRQISAGHMVMYSKPKELAAMLSERFAADEAAQVTAVGASDTLTNRTSGRAGTASARNQRNARFPLG
jgi:pimeloyl-ACP methyl ester carboxylesterase